MKVMICRRKKRGFCTHLHLFMFCPGLLTCIATTSAQPQVENIQWRQALNQQDTWYQSAEAIRIADNVLLYQLPSGGWPKNTDMARVLNEDDKVNIRNKQADKTDLLGQSTIDNSATFSQMRYLARVYGHTSLPRFRDAFLKGMDYLVEAQYACGGWPQFYPLREGYYSNITFNDGAMIGVMELLRDVSDGFYPWVKPGRRQQAKLAILKGLDLILKIQIIVDGKRTAWCAQYDPASLQPAPARSYELTSLSGAESVGIVRYLMGIDQPSTEIIHAIQGAVQWFDTVRITGIRVVRVENASLPKGFDIVVEPAPGGNEPLWARFYEIGTNRPMFLDRDGVVKYSLSEIGYERRTGYRWLGDWARHLLEVEYPEWEKRWGSE